MDKEIEPTQAKLREAFKRSGLWRFGKSFLHAISTPIVARSLQHQVEVERKKCQQYGKPAPIQRALF